jgi:quinol monooxygenase YgiN
MDQAIAELNASGAEEMFRKQPGNVIFNFSVAANDRDTLYLTDAWEDEETFEAHKVCEAMPLWYAVKDRYVVSKELNRFDTK